MTRKEKEAAIKEYAVELKKLADEYLKCANVIHTLPDNIVDIMFVTRQLTDNAHLQIAEAFDI